MRIPQRLPGRETERFEDKVILSTPTDKQGELIIYAGASGEKALSIYDGSTEQMYYDAVDTNGLVFKDSIYTYWGTDKDLWIYHSGSAGFIFCKTGDLLITGASSSSNILLRCNNDTDDYFKFSTLSNVPTIFGVGAYLRIGDAAFTSQSLTSEDDLMVSGKLEVDGTSYFEGDSSFFGYLSISDDNDFIFGSGSDAKLRWSITQTASHTLVWGLGNTSNSLIFTKLGNLYKNYDHSSQSNPTLFIHSATDPDTANDEWVSFTHDVTDAIYSRGSGVHKFDAVVRGSTSLYYQEYHLGAGQADPGGSGAVKTELNGIFSYNLDSTSEFLYFAVDIHADWDGATDIEIEVVGYIPNAETANDLIRMSVRCDYGAEHDTANSLKTQTLTLDHDIVSDNAQYDIHTLNFTLNWDEGGNILESHDELYIRVWLDDVTSAPIVTAFNVMFVNVKYKSNRVRIEV